MRASRHGGAGRTMWCERCRSGFAASVVNFPLESFASKHLSPLSNQGGHDPTNARRGVPQTAIGGLSAELAKIDEALAATGLPSAKMQPGPTSRAMASPTA